MRIAFVTVEYPSEHANYGGLATYVRRMAHLLRDAGHEVEVFLPGNAAESIEAEGIVLHRVDPLPYRGTLDRLIGAVLRLFASPSLSALRQWLRNARALARAVAVREASAPFDLVQSADFTAPGLFVARRRGRIHAVRCSSAADLYDAADGKSSRTDRLRGRLERMAMRRADVAYAPSRFLADHFRLRHHIDVRVVRPPAAATVAGVPDAGIALPERYMIHFGQLTPRKGSQFLAEALPRVWALAPDLQMVWSGICWHPEQIEAWRALWGARAAQVLVTGPLDRVVLTSVLRGAEASVLPSQVDNLPNTVIESLSSGIPVIGTRGASIDELVDDGATGRLIAYGDHDALARAMAEYWTDSASRPRGFIWPGRYRSDMTPAAALANFLALAS
jgi:glycosyltransferase involved in cell wall biosynthesis